MRAHGVNSCFTFAMIVFGGTMLAQDAPRSVSPPPGVTAQQDRQHMLDQLKIPASVMRRGPNGMNPNAPDYQNIDEAKANPGRTCLS